MAAPAPSSILDEIVAVLRTKLGASAREVRTHDFDFTDESALKDLVNLTDPGVLVCCLAMPIEETDYDPAIANATFLALCIARVQESTAQDTPGDVAMDLAGLVSGIVRGERWNGKAVKRAYKIRALNDNAQKLRLKGISVWSVVWQQQIEVQTALTTPVFSNLHRINFTEKLDGGADTPVTQANLTEDQLHGVTP